MKGPGTPKLMPKWIGPFKIVRKVADTAYELELPANLKLHDTFHVSLLKPYRSDGTVQPPPPELTTDGTVEWEVDSILGHRDRRRGRGIRREYLVQWRGYDASHNTWEPGEHLINASSKVHAYHRLIEGQEAVDQES